jgi:hypothetical protein
LVDQRISFLSGELLAHREDIHREIVGGSVDGQFFGGFDLHTVFSSRTTNDKLQCNNEANRV